MEKIALIVDRLNQPPFRKGLTTMTEFDSKSSLELLDYMCEIISNIDPDQDIETIYKEPTEARVHRIFQFLTIMKFNIPEDQVEDFQNLLLNGDKEILHTVMHWCLQRYDHLKKRAYLSKFLMPTEIPAEFMNDELVVELSQRLKEMQTDFKEVHKQVEQVRQTGSRPSELKADIATLEQESTQLKNKIQKMKKDMNVDEAYFRDMLNATSALRKEQESEVLAFERLREHRKNAQEADLRFSDASRRLSELRNSGVQNQSAEQILNKLHQDVRELNEKRESVEKVMHEREMHLEKLQSWDNADRMTTDEDVRMKRDQVAELEEQTASLQEQLDAALERNAKLVVFRQASSMAMKKFREKEDEAEKLNEELRRLSKLVEDKETELKNKNSASGASSKIGKKDLKKYGAMVREKIESYKKMREELAAMRSELVVLQRTEQILKNSDRNLEEFLTELEKQKGIEGFRENQKSMIEMAERAAEVDQMKGSTLEEISAMVEQIGREFRSKQAQLQPLLAELKSVRQEYSDVDAIYQERKSSYDKVAVGLEMEKQVLEKECNVCQEDCMREESRYHYLQNLIFITKIKLQRAEQEAKWQSGEGRLMRDFANFKDLYANKITQQEQLTKQLRKRQKELKENAGILTNQKSNFMNLQLLLEMKLKCCPQDFVPDSYKLSSAAKGQRGLTDAYTPAHAEYANKADSEGKSSRF